MRRMYEADISQASVSRSSAPDICASYAEVSRPQAGTRMFANHFGIDGVTPTRGSRGRLHDVGPALLYTARRKSQHLALGYGVTLEKEKFQRSPERVASGKNIADHQRPSRGGRSA